MLSHSAQLINYFQTMSKASLVSIHGGHSGEFCCHADDTLKQVIEAYIKQGFLWVGITEHIPPPSDDFVYPIEQRDGFDAAKLYDRFSVYMEAVKSFQNEYGHDIEILVGFETEAYSGYIEHNQQLINEFKPDYIVGSVHHVNDLDFDSNAAEYEKATLKAGGLIELYTQYFDLQYELIETLKPSVIGHFDLIRIFDLNYRETIQHPEIAERIDRNLTLIAKLGLIIEYNLKAWQKGADEPYLSESILQKAIDMEISIVPGDDSHGVKTVGMNLNRGIEILKKLGVSTSWEKPRTVDHTSLA